MSNEKKDNYPDEIQRGNCSGSIGRAFEDIASYEELKCPGLHFVSLFICILERIKISFIALSY